MPPDEELPIGRLPRFCGRSPITGRCPHHRHAPTDLRAEPADRRLRARFRLLDVLGRPGHVSPMDKEKAQQAAALTGGRQQAASFVVKRSDHAASFSATRRPSLAERCNCCQPRSRSANRGHLVNCPRVEPSLGFVTQPLASAGRRAIIFALPQLPSAYQSPAKPR